MGATEARTNVCDFGLRVLPVETTGRRVCLDSQRRREPVDRVGWFDKQGGIRRTADPGIPVISAPTITFCGPITPYLEVLSTCYAQGTCTN